MQYKYKKIYILGSGFSKSASAQMPAMRELTEMLRRGNDKKYPQLMEFINDLKTKSNDSKELTSIESISSLILGKELFYNNNMYLHYKILRNQLLHWLYEKIDNSAHEADAAKIPVITQFIKKCMTPGNKSLIITFNYDLLIERLFNKLDSKKFRLNYIIKLNRYFDYENESELGKEVFEYLKLHGSFNWFRSPGSISTNINNIYLVKDSDNERDLIHHNDIPVFIPMAYSKSSYMEGSFYNVLWNIAQRYLELAEEINFIGYGFPVTDADNLAFFLDYKNKIKHIIINEDVDFKIKRLEELFGKDKIVNIDAADYIRKII